MSAHLTIVIKQYSIALQLPVPGSSASIAPLIPVHHTSA